MPHDKNGREIQVGDTVRVIAGYHKGRIGQVQKVYPSATLCNVEVAVIVPTIAASISIGNARDHEVIE